MKPRHLLALLTMAALITPIAAQARDIVCVSSGYCVNDLTCNTNGSGEELTVKLLKGNRADFGWSPEVRFQADGIRKEGYTIYMSNNKPTGTQTFILADDMTGAMGVTTVLLDKFYNSHHALICREVQ